MALLGLKSEVLVTDHFIWVLPAVIQSVCEEDKKIVREFKFDDFAEALEFVNKVGDIAEKKGHHPDIELGWGRAKITFITHKIDGLSGNDFIMASLVDDL